MLAGKEEQGDLGQEDATPAGGDGGGVEDAGCCESMFSNPIS